MGLDAAVYCDCFEKERLKELPLDSDLVFVDRDGSLYCKSEDLEILLEFDQWYQFRACEHKGGILTSHHIGNVARVSYLYEDLSDKAEKFPLILENILYSGTHAGDFLTLEEIKNLEKEVEYLKDLVFSNKSSQERIAFFRQQLIDLTKAALEVRKPISF